MKTIAILFEWYKWWIWSHRDQKNVVIYRKNDDYFGKYENRHNSTVNDDILLDVL